jgi:uncharacterized protein involved in type VI secretion and phage assembly
VAVAERRLLDNVVLTVDGTPLAAHEYEPLTLVRVEESVLLPDYFAVHFEDDGLTLFDSARFTLGTRIEIAFRVEGAPMQVTAGEVTAISVQPSPARHQELVLTGHDLTHRLARGPKSRSFQDVTDASIAARIAREYGLDLDVEATGEVHAYVLQANETDYAFLRRRAARIGFYFWVSPPDPPDNRGAKGTFHFKRRPEGAGQPPTLQWKQAGGGNLSWFTVRFASSEHCEEVQVNGWDPLNKHPITGKATTSDLGADLDRFGTGARAAPEMAKAAQDGFDTVRRLAVHLPVADQAAADALARSLLLRTSAGEVILRGEAVGDPRLGAGAKVQIEGVGDRLKGQYRLTSVEHIYGTSSPDPYVTRFVCGGTEAAGLADLVNAGAGGLERKGWGGSLVVGIVTNNDDPEKLGRVKVKFPTLTDQDESTWARLAVPGGGRKRGMQWLPEVDDEVLVGFEHGDETRPVVLGGMWSREPNEPPQPDVVSGGRVASRVLASRGDSRLVLTDDPTRAVHLSLGGDRCHVHLEQTESRVTGEQKLVISANEIEIRATRTLSLHGERVRVTGERIIELN